MKIDLLLKPVIETSTAEAQADHARGLGLKTPSPRSGSLAVVGGGQSVHSYIETLRRWHGQVWAINGAYDWCIDRGIDCRFFSADAQPVVVTYARNAKKATLPPWCHPYIWGNIPDLEMADFPPVFSASAPNVSAVAFDIGFSKITYFGCDCSFSESTHTYEDQPNLPSMIVLANGMEFKTTPAYYTQAQEIAALCREFPDLIQEMSGGLTRALTIDPDYMVTEASDSVRRLFIDFELHA